MVGKPCPQTKLREDQKGQVTVRLEGNVMFIYSSSGFNSQHERFQSS